MNDISQTENCSVVRTSRPRRGMAMVLVLILVVVMSVAAMAAFARSSSELVTTSSARAQAEASSVAYAGLERYLILNAAVPTLPNTVVYTFANGTASVTLEQARPSTAGVRTFIIRSVGVVSGMRTTAGIPAARRTVSQVLQRQNGAIDVDAAFVALSGLSKSGISGTVSGIDECGAEPTLPGLAVPNGSYNPPNGSPNANNYIDGSPDNAPTYLGPAGFGNAAGTANAAVSVNWQSVLDGTTIQPDFTINRKVNPNTGAFPASYANWPVVRITGDVVNGDNFSGQGILVITGNANITNIQWSGIVLVGGEISVSGAATQVRGALMSGLNMKINPLSTYPYLPQSYPGQGSVGNGNFFVKYNSCNVSSALNRYGGWLRLANTWSDNWPAP
jgi:hypothetical protein